MDFVPIGEKMKTLLLFLSWACFAQTQTPVPTATVTVISGNSKVEWTFTLPESVRLTGIACNATALEPGNTTTCTLTASEPARVDLGFILMFTGGLEGPSSLVMPKGSSTITFTVKRPAPLPSGVTAPAIKAALFRLTSRDDDTVAGVVAPCCADEERCGLLKSADEMQQAARAANDKAAEAWWARIAAIDAEGCAVNSH